MDRIAKRLGLVKENAKYAEIQEAIKQFIPKDERIGGLFWLLAKYTCRARRPKCHECPLSRTCDYPEKSARSVEVR
jgi:endonuclease-3